LLPDFHAAGIYDLQRIPARGVQQPGAETLQACRLVAFDLLHRIVVVPHQHEEAFVNHGRIVELLMRMAGTQRRNRGIEDGGIAKARVKIAGDERRRSAASGAGTQ
jgi:hypothetical protein